jgi:hypothetical protein
MGEKTKIDYVFLFPGKNFSINFINSWTNTMIYLYENGYTFASAFKYAPIVHEVRNQLVASKIHFEAKQTSKIFNDRTNSQIPFSGGIEAKKVIFIDSDIVWNIEDLEKILHTDKDIMCGAYFLESGQDMCIVDKDGLFMDMSKIKDRSDIFEILSGGMGFVSVNYEVLEKIGFPWFNTLYLKDEENGIQFIGEDTFFFYRAQEEGFKIFCDPSIRIGHEKSRTLMLLDYDQAH